MTFFENYRNNAVASDESNMAAGIAEVLQAAGNPMNPTGKDCSADLDDTNSEPLESELPPHAEDGRSAIQREASEALEAIRSLGEAMQKALLKPEVAPMPREIGPAKLNDRHGEPERRAPGTTPEAAPAPREAPPTLKSLDKDTVLTSLEFGDIWSSPTA